MSALFAALQAEIGAVARGFGFDEGVLHKGAVSQNVEGDTFVDYVDQSIWGMQDTVTLQMRAGGYSDEDVHLILLRVEGVDLTDDDQVTLGGTRWALSQIGSDPVRGGWTARGTPARA